jgi:DNA-binding NarL/FixJ family response regulator
MSGYDVCRILRAQYGDELPIVFVSGERTEPFDRVAGLRLGADDYIVKPFDPHELLARVDRLVARSRAETVDGDGRPFNLTRRELEVLELLIDGLRPKEIARELSISSKTGATHIQNILVKLGVHSQGQAIATALESGLIRARRPPSLRA